MALLGRFFGTPIFTAEQPSAAVPDGRRIYAIGDVHGRLDLLDELLAAIDRDGDARGNAETSLIFLGDLIDRGPDARGVIERAMQLAATGRDVRFVLGNHEETFLAVLDGSERATRFFLRVGGAETLESYGFTDRELFDTPDKVTALVQARVPAEHRAFLASFVDRVAIGGYLFVHAGIRPGVSIADQMGTDLRWIREAFLEHQDPHPMVVVHGHTISPQVEDKGNRIGIDTGAYHSGRLTALGLEGDQRWLLTTAAGPTG